MRTTTSCRPKHSGRVASDQFITTTAAEARMRDYDVHLPRDCVASQSLQRNAAALAHFRNVMKVDTEASSSIRLSLAQRKET